jgi:alpha-glucosidase
MTASDSRTHASHQEPGLLAPGIARFTPDEVDPASLPRSLAFERPWPRCGPVPADWAVVPTFTQVSGAWQALIDPGDGTSFYGTGEVAGPLLRNGFVTEVWAKQPFRIDEDGTPVANYDERSPSLYQAHPWILAVRSDGSAFGVLADTTYRLRIDLRAGIELRCESPFPVVVIDAQSPQSVLRRLAALCGTMPLPPRWTLGYHQCRFSYYPDARVREIADGFRERRIPCDGIWIDIHYMDAYKVFTFDSEGFPDPSATNDYLHRRGFRSVWILDPAVKVEDGYSVYEEGVAGGHFLRDAQGVEHRQWTWPGEAAFPDFTRPETRRWWSELTVEFLRHGMDGIWVDLNEPSPILPHGAELPESLQHLGGEEIAPGSHGQYHNVYGMLMSKSTFDAMLACRPDRRPFVLTRSSYLGGQRYAATWTGDNVSNWEHLEWSVPMVLNLGLSGQPNSGPDIGGFAGTPTPELFAHWIAVGSFLPFCRTHNALHGNQEPWSFGAEVEEIARTALLRRYRLLPYLYTLFHEAATTGLPVARPLFFADPCDLGLRAEQRAFLLGADLRVEPAVRDPLDTPLARPQGVWRPFALLGEDPEQPAPHPRLSLRAGSMIPLGPAAQTVDEVFDGSITLLASFDEDGRATGRLYEDAGDGFGYCEGDYRLTTYEARRRGAQIELRVVQVEGSRGTRHPHPKVLAL